MLWIRRWLQLRARGQQVAQHAVEQHVGHLIPVAHRVQALGGQVVGVVAALAHALRPADQRGVQALLHLLRLLVELLLGHLLPGEAQIARHGHQAQARPPAPGEDQRPLIAVSVARPAIAAIGAWVR